MNDIYKAIIALEQGDYLTAFNFFQKACDEGNAMGCYSLGVMYETGQGVEQDSSVAKQFFSKAYDMGF